MDSTDHSLKDILERTKCIAFVGVSPKDVRPSYFVFRYMQLRGYRVIPVNPGHVGKSLLGEPIYGALSDIPKEANVDMVDIFRRSEFVPEIYDDAVRHLPRLRTVWMQISVKHPATAAKARAAGFDVVENRCPKMEYQRLFGELRKAGINTRLISSKLPRM